MHLKEKRMKRALTILKSKFPINTNLGDGTPMTAEQEKDYQNQKKQLLNDQKQGNINSEQVPETVESFWDLEMKDINGNLIKFDILKKYRKLLISNVATY